MKHKIEIREDNVKQVIRIVGTKIAEMIAHMDDGSSIEKLHEMKDIIDALELETSELIKRFNKQVIQSEKVAGIIEEYAHKKAEIAFYG